MKQENRKMSRGRRRLLGILFAVCMIVVMMPVVAFANDDEDRASGSLYILGTKITQNGEVPAATVSHTGTIHFDAYHNKLTLTNATLDLDNYYMSPETENNYAAAISAWDDLNIVLEGTNKIISSNNTYGDDKEYVFGIKDSGGELSIAGTGSLEIDLSTDPADGKSRAFTGISCIRDLSVSNCTLAVSLNGTAKCTGMDLRCCDFMINNAAQVKVKVTGEGSVGVNGTGIFDGSYVCSNSVLEMSATAAAFKCYMASDSLKETPAKVSENDPLGGNATDWDKTTYLAKYKYVKFYGNESGPERAKGSVYLLGKRISTTGDVSAATVPHEGTIHYDADKNILTLTNATLDLKNFSSPAVGNVVAGIYATSDLNVVLAGKNQILSSEEKYAKDVEYVQAIWSGGKVNIAGKKSSAVDSLSAILATKDEDANKKISFSALESDGEITFDNASVNFVMDQYGKCTGIYSWGPINLTNQSMVLVIAAGSNNKAVTGINPIGNSKIEEGSCLEMVSDGTAFDCWTPSADLKATPAWVNENATAEGAVPWSQLAALYTYKYVRFREWTPPAPDPVDISKADAFVTSPVTYTGKALTPEVTVKAGEATLTKDVDYSLEYANNTNVGTATVTVKGIAPNTGEQTLQFQIVPANNTLNVKGKTATVKYKALKKKSQKLAVSKVINFVDKGEGTLTYVKTDGNKKITIDKKSGKVTVKKGLKKKTYTVKVKVTAAGNGNYKSATKTVTFKIKVK